MTAIRPSARFDKAFEALGHETQKAVTRALVRLVQDPSHPGLNLEPLRGAAGYLSIRANRSFRIIVMRVEEGIFDVVDVGPHDIYRRYP